MSQKSLPMHKLALRKPDGRALTLYAVKPLDSGIIATAPKFNETPGQPHLRWHPLREEWVAYAAHRQNRTFLPPPQYNPLAPTTSDEFPTELPAGKYDIAVFDNLFASLQLDAKVEPELIVPTRPGNGHCEVVVFTQDPQATLGSLPLAHISLLLRVWADRYREISRSRHIQYILPFENRGVEVGVTLHHPHGQIYAYPFLPPLQQKMLQAQRAYIEKTGRSLLSDFVRDEKKVKTRLIYEGKEATAFIPACARYPYEVWVVPNRHVTSLLDMNTDEIEDLARVLKAVLLKYDTLWQRPFPYLMSLYSAPVNSGSYGGWHFHIQFYPPYRSRDRLKFLAGTELGAGMFVNDSLPEEKAEELRKIEVFLE